jgi:glycosyltransferase involved in cell wall biosynthesis
MMDSAAMVSDRQWAAESGASPDNPPWATDTLDVVELNNMVTPYTDRLFARLRADGLRIAILSCTDREANRNWELAGARRYPHAVLAGIGFRVGARRYAHWNRGISATLDRLRPKLLVINGFYPSMVFGWRWARRNRVPLALHIDGAAGDMPRSPYHWLVRPRLLRDCRAVLTCSAKGSRYFAASGIAREAIFEMPLVPAWDPPARVPGFTERSFDLLWVGEIENAVKNARFFLAVVVALHQRMPALRVHVVGRGTFAARLLAGLAAAGVAHCHNASVDWHRMDQVMQSARLLLLPSRREPWGLVCNEAMQCGTPCLVSDHVGAADDLVRDNHNGRVLSLDVDRWVEAAEALLRDPEHWSTLSDAACTDASQRTIDTSARIYRAMVASSLARERAA